MIARLSLLIVLLIAGCAGNIEGGDDDGCRVSLGFTPSMPYSGPAGEITVTAGVQNTTGVLAYTWDVTYVGGSVPFTNAAANNSAIRFTALDPGTYTVTLDVDAPSKTCNQETQRINVLDPTGMLVDVRLHVTAPFDLDVPPIDRMIRVNGGADYDLGAVVLEPGIPATGMVRTSGGTGVPAYMRISPLGMAGAITETFSNASGIYDVTLLNQPHDVLVIPSSPTLAPQKFSWISSTTSFTVSAGTAITGTVRHGVTPVSGAKVQLTIGGVPTTLGTTAGDGSFTVRGIATAGAMVKVEVTAPAASGLPRLESTAQFSVTGPIDILYSSTLQTRNIGGTEVRRGGALLGNKKVVLVGALSSIGNVTAGVTGNASGFARVTTTTNGSGVLPSLLAPAGPLSAVVTVLDSDLAVTAFNTSAAVPALIDAPIMKPFATKGIGQSPALDGIRLDLVPVDALALAGAPTLQLMSDSAGQFASSIADGGTYDAVFSDPQGRQGQRIVTDRTATSFASSYDLPPAVSVSGTLSVTGNPNKLRGAAVTILCATCSGLGRERPIAETASDQAGDFVLAVPDPGTM